MNVSVIQVNKTSVIFSWRKPANPNGVILSYEIVYSGKLSSTEVHKIIYHVTCTKSHDHFCIIEHCAEIG